MPQSSTRYVVVGAVFVTFLLYMRVIPMQQGRWLDGPGLRLGGNDLPNKPFITKPGGGYVPSNGSFITKPTPSLGCFPHKQVPGITLHCSDAVEMRPKFNHAVKREHFYKVMLRLNAGCSTPEFFGTSVNGGWHACKVEPFLLKKPCLVYSFGINNDWTFDDAVSQKYGCEVHAFDPSMGIEDHKHSDLVHFHNIGLDGENKIASVKGKNWKMRTFCTLLKDLGHTERTIDYLKFDVEFSEWAAIIAMLDEGCLEKVKQLSFEGHAWGDTESNYILFWRGIHGLENFGFQKWRVFNRGGRCFSPTETPKKRYCPQADMNFINANYLEK